MRPSSPNFGEDDLHALVDGALDPLRREAVLAFLAASPADQAKVDAWRWQNSMLRAAFAGVAQEQMPLGLRFVPRAKLAATQSSAQRLPWRSGNHRLWPFLTGLALGLGLCLGEALWFAAWPQGSSLAVLHRFFAPEPTEVFDSAAAVIRVTAALDRFVAQGATNAKAETDSRRDSVEDLQAPDLSGIGLRLTGATVTNWAGAPVGCFTFLGEEADDHFVLCRVRPAGAADFDVRDIGSPSSPIIAWQDDTGLQALAGSNDAAPLGEAAQHIRALLVQAAGGRR
jgi:anti-sigma factor RsiW